MKIRLTEQELIQLGLVNAMPVIEEDYSVDIDTEGEVKTISEKYDNEYLSLASINRTKNLLVNDLHKIAFSGKYSDLIGVPSLATAFKDGLLSKENYSKLDNLENYLKLKTDVGHLHKFSDLTEVPMASDSRDGLMSQVHYKLLSNGLSKVATTGLYTDLDGKPDIASELQDGLLSKELFKEMNAIAKTFGSSFSQNSSGIYVYNHSHTVEDIHGIPDVVKNTDIDIEKIIRIIDGYSSVYAGYDDSGNYYKGFMRGEDKRKLDQIESNANYYIHPDKHNVTMIDGLANVATTGSYSDLLGAPDILGTINSVDSQNGIAIGSTGGLQIRKEGLPRISFQRGIQYFHDANVATKASIEITDKNENELLYSLVNGVNYRIKNESGSMINITPKLTAYSNCELEVTGNITLKHLQDPEATGYNGLVLGKDTANNSIEYGRHSMGIIGNRTIGFGNNRYGTEEYTAFINTQTGDLYLKGDLYIQGTINSAYKDEVDGVSIPSLESDVPTTRNIAEVAKDIDVHITERNGSINMTDTILALLDKIEELSNIIERQDIRLRQIEKELY